MYCKPRLSRPATPTTQIGLLNCEAGYSKGNQTIKEAMNGTLDATNANAETKETQSLQDTIGKQPTTSMDILTSLFKVKSPKHEPIKTHASVEIPNQDTPPAASNSDVCDPGPSTSRSSTATSTPKISTRIVPGTASEHESDFLTQVCSRKPTRLSLFMPPCKRAKLSIPKTDLIIIPT